MRATRAAFDACLEAASLVLRDLWVDDNHLCTLPAEVFDGLSTYADARWVERQYADAARDAMRAVTVPT